VILRCNWPYNGFELSGAARLRRLIFAQRAASAPASGYAAQFFLQK
jgi:hypothetical protein